MRTGIHLNHGIEPPITMFQLLQCRLRSMMNFATTNSCKRHKDQFLTERAYKNRLLTKTEKLLSKVKAPGEAQTA
nr:hypothetical protein HmN_000116000 [Hymenolepis microstoma]